MTPIKILECLSFQLNEPWNWNPGAVSTEIPKNTCKSNRHVHIYFEWLIPLLLHPCKTNSLASFFSPDHPFWQNFDLHKQNLYSSMSSTVPHSPPPDRPDGLSENSRTLSANTLKDRLSKLTTPLNNVVNPVAALHANVKCVCLMCISFFSRSILITWTFFIMCSSFVPAQIPWKRRLQMLAVATWSVMIIITSSVWLLLWYVLQPLFYYPFSLGFVWLPYVILGIRWMTTLQLTASSV